MIPESLLSILCCPETHQPLLIADASLLARMNQAIARGEVANRSGAPVKEPLVEALVRADGQILYPLRNDIPVLLANEGIQVR